MDNWFRHCRSDRPGFELVTEDDGGQKVLLHCYLAMGLGRQQKYQQTLLCRCKDRAAADLIERVYIP